MMRVTSGWWWMTRRLAREALAAAGVKALPGRYPRFPRPWGNRIEIVGYENIQFTKALRGQPLASRQVLRVGALTTLSRNFQLEFLRPLVGRSDVELIVRSGNIRDLLAQLEAHAVDVVLANSAAPRDARSSLRNHLLNEQPVSLVGRPRTDKQKFRVPEDLRTEPLLLPSLDSDIRVAFNRVLELAGIRPTILAEVDDMAMLRLLAREREGVTLVPPITFDHNPWLRLLRNQDKV